MVVCEQWMQGTAHPVVHAGLTLYFRDWFYVNVFESVCTYVHTYIHTGTHIYINGIEREPSTIDTTVLV